MKKVTLLLIAGLFGGTLVAQEFPQPSPSSKVEQTVGLTTISLDYSRPGVNDRDIFGGLLTYGEIWRVGANACTKFTTSNELTFGKTKVAPGTYALFAFPAKDGNWKVVLNSDTEQWGAGAYDESKNVMTIKVDAQKNSFNESLIIELNNLENSSAVLSIKWDKLRVDVPFTVDTDTQIEESISAAIKKGEDLDKVYYNAASYFHNTKKDEKMTTMYLEKSMAIAKSHKSLYLKATILHDSGNNKEAITVAEEAHEMAVKAESMGWANYIKENIEKWAK